MFLMDIQMPKMDGFEATEQIRKLEVEKRRGHIPIIAVTAHPNKKMCLERGMGDSIFKPVMLDHLQALFRRWIPGSDKLDRHPRPPSPILSKSSDGNI
jgi:CheY-like chemotaxis protein